MVRLGVVGCGDVLYRSYAEGLRAVRLEAAVVACCDVEAERRERAAALCAGIGPRPRTYSSLARMLSDASLDGVLNLTPAPAHAEVSRAALAAGVHVYSEKPLAGSLQAGVDLVEQASAADRMLLCAPASMAAGSLRWMSGILRDERLGHATLAVSQLATLGPAAWRAYTGDPRVFYTEQVGPVADLGIYALHCVTGLLGPAAQVHAVGSIGIPERTVLGETATGERFEIGAPDHVLMQLDMASGAQAQILSSFAAPATQAPFLEIHCTRGTLSLREPFRANAPVDAWLTDDRALPLEGWLRGANGSFPRSPVEDLIACGVVHFARCVGGHESPLLTGRHAVHALEIAEAARASMACGEQVRLETTFDPPASALPHVGV
jgi:predicted dehydrogenase